MKIGFIGQGWIGRHYADNFEERGYHVVRYSLEEPYIDNKKNIASCDVVFIAVPTPTTPKGFDVSAVKSALTLVATNKIAVIKSTVAPGMTVKLQRQFSNLFVFHSPEFLTEKTAAHDAAHPQRNIIGIAKTDAVTQTKARMVMKLLPRAPYERVLPATEAEIIKYAGNCFLFTKVVFANLLYDLSESLEADYSHVKEALSADPRIGKSHLNPIDNSNNNTSPGRGAGGHCLIKDFATFSTVYAEVTTDELGQNLLTAFIKKNLMLLKDSEKDLDLVAGVYGELPENYRAKILS